jgi:hypothetical protein
MTLVINVTSLVIGMMIGYGLHVLWEHRAEVIKWIESVEEK